MKIVVTMSSLGPYHHAQLNALSSRFHVSVVVHEGPGERLAYADWRGGEKYARYDLARSVEKKALRMECRRLLAARKPNVIAVAGWSEFISWVALEWGMENKVPVIVMTDTKFADRPRSWLKEYFKSKLVGLFDAALVAGSLQRNYLLGLHFPERRVELGFYSADNRHFQAGARKAKDHPTVAQKALNLPKRYFLVVGKLMHIKGHDLLLKSLSMIPKARRIPLLIVGDGPEEQKLKDLANDMGIKDKVQFFGRASYSQLPMIYGLAEALLVPSRMEPWGLVVNEALACGTPVIASDVCGSAEDLLKDTGAGLILPVDDPDAWKEAMERALDPRWIRALRRKTYPAVRDWGPERFVRGMEASVRNAADFVPGKKLWMLRALIGLSFIL